MENEYIKSVEIIGDNLRRKNATEREVAIADLLNDNYLSIPKVNQGPYDLEISRNGDKIIFNFCWQHNNAKQNLQVSLPFKHFRRIIKDYFLVYDSYNDAMQKNFGIEKVEAIDMGRRGLHNEGAEMLLEEMQDKVVLDFKTARRIFTIITALQGNRSV